MTRLEQLEKLAKVAQAFVEQGVGSNDGYFPSPGKPLTEKLKAELRACGAELVFQRGKWNENK